MSVTDDRTISLRLETNPRHASWSEVFQGLKDMETDQRMMDLPYIAISSQNRVAQKSRRAVGNTFFVGPEAALDFRRHQQYGFGYDQQSRPKFFNAEIVEVDGFESNLFLTTYFKVDAWKENQRVKAGEKHTNVKVSIVDGPLAVYEDQLYVNPNWQSYFAKAVL